MEEGLFFFFIDDDDDDDNDDDDDDDDERSLAHQRANSGVKSAATSEGRREGEGGDERGGGLKE